MIETEAKFSVPDAETFAGLRQVAQLGPFKLEPAGTKHVLDRYLDTLDRRFLTAGYAYRLRQTGQTLVITLKSLTPATEAIHRRQEFEMEVGTDQPAGWPDSQIKTMVQAISAGNKLDLLFVVKQTRYKFKTYLAGKPVIEFSLDEVSLDEYGPVDYLELEAELIGSGSETELTQFVAELQAEWALLAEQRSKFERAFEARFGHLPRLAPTS